ncbi:MAG: hypothetical protein ABJL44_00065 [Algibacter sp.]
MENIKLELTIDETNTMLAALGEQSYVKVANLIQKIQQQGASQLKESTSENHIEKQKELKKTLPEKDGK